MEQITEITAVPAQVLVQPGDLVQFEQSGTLYIGVALSQRAARRANKYITSIDSNDVWCRWVDEMESGSTTATMMPTGGKYPLEVWDPEDEIWRTITGKSPNP